MMIKWLEDAVYDLRALREYIAQDNSIAASHVVKRIRKAVKLLSEQPEIGRVGRAFNTRELVVSGTP